MFSGMNVQHFNQQVSQQNRMLHGPKNEELYSNKTDHTSKIIVAIPIAQYSSEANGTSKLRHGGATGFWRGFSGRFYIL